jgi:hypothetical protein
MTITLNPTIVLARDKEAAARTFAELFGLPVERTDGQAAGLLGRAPAVARSWG